MHKLWYFDITNILNVISKTAYHKVSWSGFLWAHNIESWRQLWRTPKPTFAKDKIHSAKKQELINFRVAARVWHPALQFSSLFIGFILQFVLFALNRDYRNELRAITSNFINRHKSNSRITPVNPKRERFELYTFPDAPAPPKMNGIKSHCLPRIDIW